jgi:hypothetical protein
MLSKSQDWGVTWTEPQVISGMVELADRAPTLIANDENGDTIMHCFMDRYEQNVGGDVFYLRHSNHVTIEDNQDLMIPQNLSLGAYPNPFNSTTIITINNVEGGETELTIYNLNGQKVRSFPSNSQSDSRIIWDATDDRGQKVSSGMYFAKVESANERSFTKMVYLK